MEIDAAVSYGPDQPFAVERLLLDAPRAHEVLVRIVACGVCHTDSVVRQGHLPFPMPAVLGHEGAGVVEKVGEGVTGATPGDHVVLSLAWCGHCQSCAGGRPGLCARNFELNFGGARPSDGSRTLRWPEDAGNGDKGGGGGAPRPPVHGCFFMQSSFATFALCDASSYVVVPRDLPLAPLAPLGCSVLTGAGAVLNSLRCRAGSTIMVFGVGGVGMCSVMAAAAAGSTKIVAVDVLKGRLTLAKEVGATHVVDSRDSVEAKAMLTDISSDAGGFDFAIDTTGKPDILRLAVECLRPGGIAVHIGASTPGAEFSVDMLTLLQGRTVRGTIMGDAQPRGLIPKIIELYRAGKMPFDRLVTYYDGLDKINDAVRDSANGAAIKPVIRISEDPSFCE